MIFYNVQTGQIRASQMSIRSLRAEQNTCEKSRMMFNNLYIVGCILRTVREYAYCPRVYCNDWNIYCCNPCSCNSNRVNYHLSRYRSVTIDPIAYTNFQVNQPRNFVKSSGCKTEENFYATCYFSGCYCKINRAIRNSYIRISNILTLDILRASADWEIPLHSVGLFKKIAYIDINCLYHIWNLSNNLRILYYAV